MTFRKVFEYNYETKETTVIELQEVDVIAPEENTILTMEQMAIALMQTQTELEDAQIALDFLLM